MKQILIAAGAVALFAGCTFTPESMPVGPKDSLVYVDAGAPESLATKENRTKVAVIAMIPQDKSIEDALDSALNAKLSKFAFFELVDRKSTEALIKDSLASGAASEEIDTTGVEADFVVVARMVMQDASTNANTDRNANVGVSSYPDVVFDFKWISKASQKVIMSESMSYKKNVTDAAREAASEFCTKIAVRYAPPARVLQTRGNGAAARISVGKNYGVGEGAQVCFYEIIDNSDVGGEKRDMSDIASGVVKRVEEKTSWVAVNDAEKVNVRKGVYVRVLEGKKSGLGDMFGNALLGK